MRLQVYYRFGDWLDTKGNPSVNHDIYYSPITKPVYLIHDSLDPDKNKKLIEGNLHMKDSAAGSVEFSVTRKHPLYSKFCNILLDTVYIVIDGLLMWDGRPTKLDIDWNGTKKIYFEGALSYLNDCLLGSPSYIDAKTMYDFMVNNFIDKINANMVYMDSDRYSFNYYLNDRMFYPVGSVVIDELGQTYNWNPNYETCADWLKKYILGDFQARCKIVYPKDAVNTYLLQNKPIPRYLCITNNLKRSDIANQLPTKYINFGKNMLSYSYTKEINEDFATNYVPRGKTVDDSTGREMKKFVMLSTVAGDVYLDNTAFNKGAKIYYRDMKHDQRHYGQISKAIDFSSVTSASTLWACAREKYKTIRRSPFVETIVVSGADIEPAEKIKGPTPKTPTLSDKHNDAGIVAAETNIAQRPLFSVEGESTWPKWFEYYRCHPTYFDLWTRVIAKSKPHFVGSKTWYITGIDLSFDNPLTPGITMENNAKSLTDEYIKSGAQIGDVAGAFQPSS